MGQTMKYRVQQFKKTQHGKIYHYSWIGYSYRTAKGTPTFKRVASLAGLPPEAVKAISNSLSSNGESSDTNIKVEFLSAIPLGAEAVAHHFADELGILDALACLPERDRKVVLALILDRVVEAFPHSRKSLFENLPGSGLSRVCGLDDEDIKLEQMYYALDHLFPCQDTIEHYLFKRNHPNQSRMFLYDITSSYFEGNACPLEAFGYNRDHKQGKKQIVIGMLTDQAGCPVSVEVFEGNTSDQSTVMDRIDSMRKKFGIEEMVFIGDRGMLTRARRNDLTAREYEKIKYITALSRDEFTRFVEDDDHPLQLSLFDRTRLVQVSHDGINYVLSYNPELEERNCADRDRMLEKTEAVLKGIEASVQKGRLRQEKLIAKRLFSKFDKWKCARFFDVDYGEGRFSYRRKDELIESYRAMDGFYVFTTDILDISAEQTRDEYRGLQQVEQTFRTMKTTDIFMRPIRLWNPERVKAHIFVCMLAYMIIWKARHKLAEFTEPQGDLRVSLQTAWSKLGELQIGKIKLGDEVHEQLSQPEAQCRQLLKLAGLSASAISKSFLRG